MSEIVIEKLKPVQWDDAMALIWKTFLRYEAGDYPEEGIHSFLEFISDERLKKLYTIGEYPVYTAYLDGKMAGVISLRSGNHISLLFVEGTHHRKGIGRALVEVVKDHVREESRRKFLTVNASPYGVEFYHRVGFVDTDSVTQKEGIIYTPMRCEI